MAAIIPAKNEANWVEAAVASARAEGVSVFVVDGGSADDTRARAQRAGATVVCAEAGRARQLAAGVEAAGEVETLIFLHADTRLPNGYASAIRRALGDARVAGGAFAFAFGFEEGVDEGFDERRWSLRLVEWGAQLRCRLFALPYGDQGLFVRRCVLEAMGGVPRVPLMEDVDLVRGMKAQGELALLSLPATTSARRYRSQGIARTVGRHTIALLGYFCGVDRQRLAGWLSR